ncbi:TerB family tellurite resistance protein [Flavobacterium sp. MAHUQ-51]|uniref:TerB family tellurite resistance protein n=1 Tax=Flavobacterium sp. GCM10022190 TaxID=3252639 RepID=UPI0036D3A679
MKKRMLVWIVFLWILFPIKTSAQSQELQQLILNIEKLAQFKQILQDMKKGYIILNGGYNTIKDLSQGNFSLHKTFLDGLMQVSPTVKKYKRISEIINYQMLLMKEYKAALKRFKGSTFFNDKELQYIESVYGNLFQGSLRNIDELMMVVTANKLRMSDDERLEAIDRIFADMQDKLLFLRSFNNNTSVLSMQRFKELKDANAIKDLYKVTN